MESVAFNWQDTEPGALASPQALARNLTYQLNELREFEHVQRKVYNTWGTTQGRAILRGFILDDRGRAQIARGFPPLVLRALATLLELHDHRFPQHVPQASVWDEYY